MRILFCGISVPEKIEYQVKHISAAGNRFQNNMIRSLREMGHEVIVLSYIAIPIPEGLCSQLQDTDGQKYVVRHGGIKGTIEAVQKCKEKVQSLLLACDLVIAYNAFYSFLYLPALARRYGKKSVLILADYSGIECYTNIKGKAYAWCQQQTIRKYDTVVGLSVNVQNGLKANQKFLLMEGGIDQAFYEKFSLRKHVDGEPVRFMYSGLLSKVTGVDILLKAMEQLNENHLELWISGKGELEEQVIAAARKDNRIKYLGHMEYSEYMDKLQSADVLVNPRNMALPENQNNFPSKIMEYLAVGKTILSSKFVGWEKFQREICFYEDDLAVAMKEMCRQMEQNPKLQEEAFQYNRQRAKEYLWAEQIKRLLV